MENIHGFDEDAYYYCPNKECVCNQKDDRITQWHDTKNHDNEYSTTSR